MFADNKPLFVDISFKNYLFPATIVIDNINNSISKLFYVLKSAFAQK